jgi:hypothetical protein
MSKSTVGDASKVLGTPTRSERLELPWRAATIAPGAMNTRTDADELRPIDLPNTVSCTVYVLDTLSVYAAKENFVLSFVEAEAKDKLTPSLDTVQI